MEPDHSTAVQTVRQQYVQEGRMADISFDEWCAQLDAYDLRCGRLYGDGGPIAVCGVDSWRGYYDDGYDPDYAISEDQHSG